MQTSSYYKIDVQQNDIYDTLASCCGSFSLNVRATSLAIDDDWKNDPLSQQFIEELPYSNNELHWDILC